MYKKEDFIIETPRLILRPFETDDYKTWDLAHKNRLSSQYKYDEGFIQDPYSKEWFENWVEKYDQAAEKDEMYVFGIFRKEDGMHIGEVEMFKILRMDYEWGMMGYSIHNQFFKQGYGKESVKAATEFFFYHLGYHRLELHINIDNNPSIQLAKSTGFKYECTREQFYFENGRWTDMLIYYQNRMY